MSSVHRMLVFLATFLCWGSGEALQLTDPLSHSTVLDPDGKYHVSWDFDDEKIVFEVRVQTLGYVGFGLSPNGGMKGADIVIGGVNADGMSYFEDRHAIGMSEPLLDNQVDWRLESASQNDTHTVLRFWRKLDTCDEDDIPVTDDTARVIWAYHDNDWADAEMRYHGKERGSKSIILLNQQKVLPKMPDDVITVDYLNNKVKVPAKDTVYWCEAFSMHTFQDRHHVIKVEPIIQPGNEQLVHHIVMYACPLHTANETAGQGGPCWADFMPPAWGGCITTVFAWAVGGGPLYLPEHVGYPFGYDDDPKLILLQTHFDNPAKRSDWVDSSGLRLTLTRQLRQYDAGSLSVGSVVWKTHFIPPYEEKFITEGHCVPECLREGMGNVSEINIFATFPHAHLLGHGLRFRHFRNGEELRPIVADYNYDFNYQETRILTHEVKVRPGDHLSTECIYNSMDKTTVTFGGESTNEEMCLSFAMYYPRIPLANCHSYVPPQMLATFANVTVFSNFTVDTPESERGRRLDDIIANDIDWTDEKKRKQIQELITSPDNPVVAFCYKDTVFTPHGSLINVEVKSVYKEKSICLSSAMTSSAIAVFVYVTATLTLLFQ